MIIPNCVNHSDLLSLSALSRLKFSNNLSVLNNNIEARKITQTGSFYTLIIALSGKVVCIDSVFKFDSNLTNSSTDLVQLGDATLIPYIGCPLVFCKNGSQDFYPAYISANGMIRALSPIPAGNYMLSGTWIIS